MRRRPPRSTRRRSSAASDVYKRQVYISSVVSGLVDVDAITISVSKLSGEGSGLDLVVASRAVVFAAASNTLVKGGIVFSTASPQVRKLVFPGMVLTLVTAVATVLLI